MNKIHIALVGGQAAPIYQMIDFLSPEKVILICSSDTLLEAERIKKEFEENSNIRIIEIIAFDVNDFSKILKSTEELKKQVQDKYSMITVNITGGLKPWGLALFKVFSKLENTAIYYLNQNQEIWDLKTAKKIGNSKLKMDAQFRLYGNPLTHFIKFDQFSESDFICANEIENLRSFNIRDFNYLTERMKKNPNETFVETKDSSSSLRWVKDSKLFEITLSKKNSKKIQKKLESEYIRNLMLNSGWFELKIAKALSKWAKTKEMRLNCKFNTIENSPKNEIDIIIDTSEKILFIECKTQIFKETDIDKFYSTKQAYAGTASIGLFITDTPLTAKAIEKCNDHKLSYFSIQNVKNGNWEEWLLQKIETNLSKSNA